MEFIYVMINSSEWEDIVIYLSEEEAIESSITYPNIKIEIFGKNPDYNGWNQQPRYYRQDLCSRRFLRLC